MSDFTSNLPEEVLAGCFDGLRLRDVISASHVSRYWRSSALAFPSLWTHIDIRAATADPENVVHMAISRAGKLLVDFEYVQLSEWFPTRASDVAEKYMHRFRSFKWISSMSFLDVTRPAPLLQEFNCSDYEFILPMDFLGGECASLRILILAETRFPPDCPALTPVVHLRASYPWAGVGETHFWRLFDLCPRVETLHLRHLIGVPGQELPAGPAPRALQSAKLKAHAYCDLLKVYEAWQLSSIERVRLTMRLTDQLDISPLVSVAERVLVLFDGRKWAHIFAYLSDSRRHVLVFNEIGHRPSLALAQLLRDAPGMTHIQTLHVPLNVLAPLLSKQFVLPHLANLVVYIVENDEFDTFPYLDGEEHQAFRWTPLICLLEVPQCFPSVSLPILAVHKANRSVHPDLDDAQGLVTFLSVPGNCTLREVHVEGFPEEVTRLIPVPLESDSPRVVFTVGVHETFMAHPSTYSADA